MVAALLRRFKAHSGSDKKQHSSTNISSSWECSYRLSISTATAAPMACFPPLSSAASSGSSCEGPIDHSVSRSRTEGGVKKNSMQLRLQPLSKLRYEAPTVSQTRSQVLRGRAGSGEQGARTGSGSGHPWCAGIGTGACWPAR